MSRIVNRHAGALQLVFVVGVIAAAFFLSAAMKPDTAPVKPAARASAVPVTVFDPVGAPYSPSVQLNGVVEARTVTSIIPQVSGRVVEVSPSFRPGAQIASGDVLFVIDPVDYELAVDRTLADIEAARSELARLEAEAAAEREVWRAQFADRPIPDLIARVPQIAAAKARVRSGQAARRAAELALSRTTVRAPFAARVLEAQLDVGQVVVENAAVGSIFSLDSLEIVAPVSADDLSRIGSLQGRKAQIFTQSPDLPVLEGEVVRKAASVDRRTRLGSLFIAAERSEALTLGEFVTIEIAGDPTPQAFRLPAAALTTRDRLWVVQEGRLADRRVDVLGREADTAIVKVFDTADGVVAVPPPNVRDGLPVAVQSPANLVAAAGLSSGAD